MQLQLLGFGLVALTAAADTAKNYQEGSGWGDDWGGDWHGYYGGSLASIVNDIPTCALPCLASRAAAWGCSSTDLRCLCDYHGAGGLAVDVSACIPGSCSLVCMFSFPLSPSFRNHRLTEGLS
jgi:hypothetical protein